MSLSDMRRLIDLTSGKNEETAPQLFHETDLGSPSKNFSRWGNAEATAPADLEGSVDDSEELDERIDGLGAYGGMQGFDATATGSQRAMRDVMLRAVNNPTKSVADIPLTEPHRELIAQKSGERVGYNMKDVVNSPKIVPQEKRHLGGNLNIKV